MAYFSICHGLVERLADDDAQPTDGDMTWICSHRGARHTPGPDYVNATPLRSYDTNRAACGGQAYCVFARDAVPWANRKEFEFTILCRM